MPSKHFIERGPKVGTAVVMVKRLPNGMAVVRPYNSKRRIDSFEVEYDCLRPCPSSFTKPEEIFPYVTQPLTCRHKSESDE